MLVRCRNDAGTMLVRCRNGAGFRFCKWEPFRACSLEMQSLCSPSEEQQNMVAHQTKPSGANQQCSSQNARHLPTCLLNTWRWSHRYLHSNSAVHVWIGRYHPAHTNLCGPMEGVSCSLIVRHKGCHIVGALDSLPHSVSPKGSSSPIVTALRQRQRPKSIPC